MSSKSDELIIAEFEKGIANSPHLGFADIRNLDIHTSPGVVKIQYLTTKESSTTVTALVSWIVRDPNTGNIYALDEGNKVYKSTDGGDTWTDVTGSRTTTSGTGNGLAVWKDYVFACRNTKIDVMNISTGTWTNNWQTITSEAFHPMLWGQDDILYGGANRYIFSVSENANQTFVPGTSATYTFSSQALDLPAQYKVKCLAELGKNLMIGTWVGANLYEQKLADIFPWDRVSSSFNLPLRIGENGVNQLLTVNNSLYIHAGIRGRLYISNGTVVKELRKLPNLNFANGEWINPYPGGIAFHDGKIILGFAQGGGNVNPVAVHGIRNAALTVENTISTANVGAAGGVSIGGLLSVANDNYLIGWKDGSTFGIDRVGASGFRYTAYSAYLDSALYHVGLPNALRTFNEIEFQLAQPLATGQGIKLSYRTDDTSAFTDIGTYDFATFGAIQGKTVPANIVGAQYVQIRIALTTGSSSTTSPELRIVTLR